MTERCCDDGALQAYLDKELAPEQAREVASHMAHCDPCAAALVAAEAETALVFSAIDGEFNTLVPTRRLWAKINESIEVESRNRGLIRRLTAFLTGLTLTGQVGAVLAGLMLVVAGSALLTSFHSRSDGGTAEIRGAETAVDFRQLPLAAVRARDVEAAEDRAETLDFRPSAPRVRSVSWRNEAVSGAERTVYRYLPGEESYVGTISNLERTLDPIRDEVMRPSDRFAFERNLAVVNDAIRKMRAEVRRNPGNEAAKQVLFASYQNKIDLLNAVTQRSEMMTVFR